MHSRILKSGDQVSWILVLDEDDEVIATISSFARSNSIASATFQAIGAFREATLGYFSWDRKEYERIAVGEQVELVSLLGDIARGPDGPVVHAHAVLGRRDGTALAGHLLAGRVRPTLELILSSAPAALARRYDPRTGLALIDTTYG